MSTDNMTTEEIVDLVGDVIIALMKRGVVDVVPETLTELEDQIREVADSFESRALERFQPNLPGTVVALDEEYGYRYWVWETGMSEVELKEFFLNMNPMEYFFHDMDKLPGKVHRADLCRGGMVIFGENAKDRFFDSKGAVQAHIHIEDDTWVKIGDELIEPTVKFRGNETSNNTEAEV